MNEERLVEGIVKQAVKDYVWAKEYLNKRGRKTDTMIAKAKIYINDVERFFLKGAFELYTGMDGELFLNMLNKKYGLNKKMRDRTKEW